MTYAQMFERILKARKFETLRNAVDFYEMVVCDVKGKEDVFIGVLEDLLAEKKNSPIHQMLLDYIKDTYDEDELLDALYEFKRAIEMFKTIKRKEEIQIKTDDFSSALNKAEEICGLKSILESRYAIEVIETKAVPFVDYLTVVTHKKKIYVLLPLVKCEEYIKPILERILGFCLHRFCSEQFDFQTVSEIMKHFMPPEQKFEQQLRQMIKEKTHNIMNGIEDEIDKSSEIFGKNIFEAIKKKIE